MRDEDIARWYGEQQPSAELVGKLRAAQPRRWWAVGAGLGLAATLALLLSPRPEAPSPDTALVASLEVVPSPWTPGRHVVVAPSDELPSFVGVRAWRRVSPRLYEVELADAARAQPPSGDARQLLELAEPPSGSMCRQFQIISGGEKRLLWVDESGYPCEY